jgi:hypothetical protein
MQYRCYFLNDADHIVKVEAGEWADDTSAKGWAKTLHGQNPQYRSIELWDGKRLVERRQRVAEAS